MKQHTKNFLLIVLCIVFFLSADAQKNKSKTTKTVSKEEVPLPPPVMEEIKEVKIDTLSVVQEPPADAPTRIPPPQIDFDTTAIPEDLLTNRIREYMNLTRQMELATGLMKKIYDNNDMKSLLSEEYTQKFIKAYESGGVGYKYLELMYIKSYRRYYTVSDINELITFYQTPIGKKMTEVNPLMIGENTTEATKLGKWVGMNIYLKSN